MKIKRLLARYGRPASLFDGNGNLLCESKCLIQPLRYKNKLYLEGIPTDIGINEAGCYLFLAPPEFDPVQKKSISDRMYISSGQLSVCVFLMHPLTIIILYRSEKNVFNNNFT